MTSNKYVVLNCPAITTGWNDKDYICNTHQMGCGHCQDCTDCVIKQVIEKCKGAVSNCSNFEILRTACETSEAYGKADISEQILRLFNIEEIWE